MIVLKTVWFDQHVCQFSCFAHQVNYSGENFLLAAPLKELLENASGDQTLIVTDSANVLCLPTRDTSNIAPCNHEEADSRIMVHVSDAVMQGFHKILVRTVDTDVVVLAVAVVQQLAQRQQIELWIAFGCGKDFKYIPAHEICA